MYAQIIFQIHILQVQQTAIISKGAPGAVNGMQEHLI